MPPVGDLYYSYAFLDLYTNNFAYVSHRLFGGNPPTHMIVGPAWDGTAAAEVKLIRAPGNSVWLLGRLLVETRPRSPRCASCRGGRCSRLPDMRNERRILEAGELMRQGLTLVPEPVADWPAPDRADPFDLFEVASGSCRKARCPSATTLSCGRLRR